MAQRNAAPGGSSPAAAAAIARTVLLSRRAWLGRQSVEYHAIREVSSGPGGIPTRLSVKIDVDSYDFQSSAKIERWDGATWQPVASIPYPLMACVTTLRDGTTHPLVSYVSAFRHRPDGPMESDPRPDVLAILERDEAELVRLASLVMGF